VVIAVAYKMRARASIAATLLLVLAAVLAAQPPALGSAERIADGVVLHRLDDPGLLNPAGPIAVQALRLEPDKIRLVMGLAEDRVPAREGVEQIASRHGAIAAVNGGFFALEDGMPNGLLKSGGRVLGGTARARGAVGITDRRGAVRLLFDRVTATTAPEKNGRRETSYGTRLGTSAKDWARATDAVSGAGLLVRDGRDLTEWKDERLSDVFDITRHPRTMIGVAADGAIWRSASG
jgi:Phosphodiester glycosidase